MFLKVLYHVAFNIMPYVQWTVIYSLFVAGPLSIGLGIVKLFRRTTSGQGGPSNGLRGNIVRLTRVGSGVLNGGSGGGGGAVNGSAGSHRLTRGFVRYAPINIAIQSKEDA